MYLNVNSDLLLRVLAFSNNMQPGIWIMSHPSSSGQHLLPQSNWLVTVVLTCRAWGKEPWRVRSIWRSWMFDEGVGIKSRECAGIQIRPEYIMPSIIPPRTAAPLDWPVKLWRAWLRCPKHQWAAHPSKAHSQTCEGITPTPPPLCLVYQLSRLQVAENTPVEESMRVL